MLAPHELKNKTFGKSLKGYNVAEVDDYINESTGIQTIHQMRWLAEEMVLYYHGPQEKQTFEEK